MQDIAEERRRMQQPPARAGVSRAEGGKTGKGAYMVGEKGPEMFVPDKPGTIVPNHEIRKLARKYGGKVGRAEGGRIGILRKK